MSSNDDEKNKQAIERTSEGSANEEARNGPLQDKSTQKGDDTLVTPESPTAPSSTSAQLKRKRVESDSKPIARRSDAESADQFPLWVAGSSPAKFIDRENLMNVSSAFENLALVHEISLNSNFELPSSPTNPIEKAVKECVHRAFWDKIRDDLREDPPEYTSAFQVLMDIKKMIFEVIPEDRVRLRDEVESNLDEKLLKQQIDNGCFEVDRITAYLVELMSRLCAPVRDEQLKKIREAENIVDILRGTCELLDQTKIDIANFTIKQNRSEIEAYSAEYELTQFKKIMDLDPGIRTVLVEWFTRHIDEGNTAKADGSASPSCKRRFEDLNNSEVNAIISRAYLELLDWNVKYKYPPTLLVDRNRLEAIAEKVLQLIVCTSCVLITCNLAGKEVCEFDNFKGNLKNQLVIITNDIEKSNINERLELVYAQCEKGVLNCYKELNLGDYDDEKKAQLRAQIMAVSEPNNQVRKLMQNRINSFILSMISHESTSTSQRLPIGVSMVEQELTAVLSLLTRIISHNRTTFGTLYGELIKEAMSN